MPAATQKTDLIAVTQKEFAKLDALISDMSLDTAVAPRPDATTIKDIIGHRAHWIDLFLGWYRDGVAGRHVHFPAPGYKWNQLKPYNAMIREQQRDLDWQGACQMLRDRHQALIEMLSELDQAALYGGPMAGANNTWTAGRWAEAAGAAHYRSANKWIRACLRADANSRRPSDAI